MKTEMIKKPLLGSADMPAALNKMDAVQLEQVASEIREKIIDVVAANGGHLASSLGVVELSIALHKVFNTPEDKIVWDVGHQAYAHKLLTGRIDRFDTLRQLDGISGFPKRSESEHDCFDVGHSSTSISAALGMVAARDIRGSKEKVVAVIGDGSLTAGLAFEGLNQAGHLKRDMIVILNDNDMSISPNVGALSNFVSKKLTSDFFVRLKRETENLLDNIPKIGKDLRRFAKKVEESVKGFLTPGILFEAFGFEYVGPIDGHDLEELTQMLDNASRMDGPILFHVVTQKGRGYAPAEENPSMFHGVGPFDRKTGTVAKSSGPPSYTTIFGETLVKMAEQDESVVAISAAMLEGTGLKKFAQQFPERFFDVGIAEQHAVTFAAGLAVQGMKPVCAIYSTFLQRAYDNVLHDVCLQKLPVTFALDRGGLVGADGPTHHGVFDHSYLRHIPNLIFASPRNEIELQRVMITAASHNGPFAYRYPRGSGKGCELSNYPKPFEIGRGEVLRDGKDAAIIAIGTSVQESLDAAVALEKDGLDVAVIDARFIKPLDEKLIIEYAEKTGRIITVEENVVQGGFGTGVLELLNERGIQAQTEQIGLPDSFVEQGTQAELRQRYGIDAAGIRARLQTLYLEKQTA